MKKKIITEITSRSLAIDCLVQWQGSGKPIQGFIKPLIHQSGLRVEDRQLAVMLVMGVLRRQQYLDAQISRFSRTKLKKMKPLTLAALRIGVLQLCFLERIPDSAAVNETVKALKTFRQPGWLISFVNGLLRNIGRNKDKLLVPETADAGRQPFTEHPVWLTKRWQKNYGQAGMKEICRVNSLEPQLCLQVNVSRTNRSELRSLFAENNIVCRPGSYAPESLILLGQPGAVTDLPGFSEGFFQVQDQAAQLSCLLLAPLDKEATVLDCCAGLGGKTSTIAARLPAGASLVAVEPDKRRSRLLMENLARLRLTEQVTLFRQDLQEFAATEPGFFTGIFLDVPCSGTGVIRKHPDIRWNRREKDILAYQTDQLALLQTAAPLLAEGGILVYATCSLEPEENQQVIEKFLTACPEFSSSDCRDFLPASAGELVDSKGFFWSLPGREREGFFAARLVRTGSC
jgi:16S rRNA (cytosine967-C5)-methyltransferase